MKQKPHFANARQQQKVSLSQQVAVGKPQTVYKAQPKRPTGQQTQPKHL